MALHKLDNIIQNYAWGSKYSINQLFGIANPNQECQAEIWMGAHPNGCSKIAESGQLLSELISSNPISVLGEYTSARFGELPYLFKVLAAETPLSIQVHPNKRKAEIGFERENKLGISLNAGNRNYKDPNHKPELVYALTSYKAMNGFRPIEHIIALFEEAEIPSLAVELEALRLGANSAALQTFFTAIMSLDGERKKMALEELYAAQSRSAKTEMGRKAMLYSKAFKQHYAGDIGLFAPLMLNIVELDPGEAMFLFAETPHAYVQGTGLEIMANSDNVLRAGLTPKYIDVPELIDNTLFEPTNPQDIKLQPVTKDGKQFYPIPVDDFGFDILPVKNGAKEQHVRGAEILFCIEGEITVSTSEQKIRLCAGQSAFISYDSGRYYYQGKGTLARAYN